MLCRHAECADAGGLHPSSGASATARARIAGPAGRQRGPAGCGACGHTFPARARGGSRFRRSACAGCGNARCARRSPGGEGCARRASDALGARYPGLAVAGTFWGYFDRTGEENRNLLGVIRACRPAVLLVCLGYPAQEVGIAANLSALPSVRVAVGLGGSFDVWAGDVPRAPLFWQRAGLEWAWRMLREPARMANLPALARFSRLSRASATKCNVKLHMEEATGNAGLNKCYENDNFPSKPL